MLLLKSQQVEYCQAIVLEDRSSSPIASFIYHNRLFTKGEVYHKAQKKQVFERIREILDTSQTLLVAAIEEAESWSLWYFNSQLEKRVANGKVVLAKPNKQRAFVSSALAQLTSLDDLMAD